MSDCAACKRLPAQDDSVLCHVCRAEHITAVRLWTVRQGALSPYRPLPMDKPISERKWAEQRRQNEKKGVK